VSEARILRDRQAFLGGEVDRSGELPPDGAAAILAVTTTVDTYPTSPSAFYAANPAEFNSDETEGAPATLVSDTSTLLFAYNLGTEVPPAGTQVVCHAVGGRWCFRYDVTP
jgi:hypothetical protein